LSSSSFILNFDGTLVNSIKIFFKIPSNSKGSPFERYIDMKEVAGGAHMSGTDFAKNVAKEYVTKSKADTYYRLTANAQDASAEESEEILSEIKGLSDDDLAIVSAKRFSVSVEE
jgi:hypothetical protein